MALADRSVYISYSWGAEKKHPLVDGLLAALKEKRSNGTAMPSITAIPSKPTWMSLPQAWRSSWF
jgi:hypothetical protein